MVYMTAAMPVFAGFVSLAVDVAHVRIVKTELQFAADAASRAAATGLGTSTTTATNNAVAVAADNYADGTSVTVSSSTDVQLGSWSNGTFTVLTGSAQSGANAVRVSASRTAAKSNAVSLYFANVIGLTSCDVTCTSTAYLSPGTLTGMVGLSYITLHNNLFVGSYSSSVTTTPTQGSAGSNGLVQSNGAISGVTGSGNVIHGNVDLGPSGSTAVVTVTGTTTTVSTITEPSVTAQVVTNPGGVSQTPTVNGTVSWPGGTYYLTSLTMNGGTINFTGPATIYLNGNANIQDSDTIAAYDGLPANLVIYETSGYTFSIHDHNNITCSLIMPGSTFIGHDSDNWYGGLIGGNITWHDNDSFYCDQSLSGSTGGVSIVQ